MNLIHNIYSKITLLKLLRYLPGANDLNHSKTKDNKTVGVFYGMYCDVRAVLFYWEKKVTIVTIVITQVITSCTRSCCVLKKRGLHDDNCVITGFTGACQHDNLLCSQQYKSCHCDSQPLSVFHHSLCVSVLYILWIACGGISSFGLKHFIFHVLQIILCHFYITLFHLQLSDLKVFYPKLHFCVQFLYFLQDFHIDYLSLCCHIFEASSLPLVMLINW